MVGWLRDRAESGALRWWQWGGRWDAGSGEQAARPGLHSGVQAQAAPVGKLEAIRRSRHWAEQGAEWQQQWRPRRGLGARARRDGANLYIQARGGGVDFLCAKASSRGRVAVWPGYGGMGGDVRWPSSQWREAVPPSSAWGRSTWHQPKALDRVDRTLTQWPKHRAWTGSRRGDLGVRTQAGGSACCDGVAHDVACVARLAHFKTQGSTVWLLITWNFETQVDQVINSKVVDQLTLYHFYRVRPWFGSTDFAGHTVEHGRKLGSGE
jgi:hypothetical protein